MRKDRGSVPLTDKTLRLAVHKGSAFIVFIDFLHASGGKSIFTKFGLAPELN